MAIRREDQSLWERRAPLGPHHVRKLIKEGKEFFLKQFIQPIKPSSQKRRNVNRNFKTELGDFADSNAIGRRKYAELCELSIKSFAL